MYDLHELFSCKTIHFKRLHIGSFNKSYSEPCLIRSLYNKVTCLNWPLQHVLFVYKNNDLSNAATCLIVRKVWSIGNQNRQVSVYKQGIYSVKFNGTKKLIQMSKQIHV